MMVTDHELRMEAVRISEENDKLISILLAVDHTLTVHGHVDAFTPLHQRICRALELSSQDRGCL